MGERPRRAGVGRSGAPEETGPRAPVLVGKSAALRRVRSEIRRFGWTGLPVLIQGETGTGKGLVAELLHGGSKRSGRFVTVNCASLSDTLFESEVFGHAKGAFTGAERSRAGLVEYADGGTLFLDEVGELFPEHQAKLLRMLEQQQVRRVGSNEPRDVDVRVIAATNRDLVEERKAGRFREDLFYRLAAVTLELPPLRERPADLGPLVEHFVGEGRCTIAALERLRAHPWPGNVRELKTALQLASVRAGDGPILPEHLPAEGLETHARVVDTALRHVRTAEQGWVPLREAVARFERGYVVAVLQAVGGNKSRAAEILGVDRRTVYRKLHGDRAG